MRTPLTYYGGKQKLAAQIVSLMPEHYGYLEPFCGGAAVLFAKPRAERETLNDLDGTIMRFWRALRDEPGRLAEVVAATPYSRMEWQLARDLDVPDDVEAARRLLINVDQSYARTRKSWSPPTQLRDRKGRWQPATWATMPERVLTAASRLRGVALEARDGLELIPAWDLPNTTIYVDPPYPMSTRNRTDSGRWRAYHHEVTDTLWADLILVLAEIKHAAVLLSGYPCDEVAELGWHEVDLTTLMASSARTGGVLREAPERLWLSPQCVDRGQQMMEFA